MVEFGIPGVVLMENAARQLAEITLEQVDHIADEPPRVLVVCGTGNNGGDGFAAARHLQNAGCDVTLFALGVPRAGTDAAINHAICRSMKIRLLTDLRRLDDAPFDLIVDAVFGTGLDREVEGAARDAIQWINTQAAPVVAADVPSGLNADTGEPMGLAVRADLTVTFVGVKTGMLELSAQPWVGDLVVADIGAPIELYHRFGDEMQMPPPDDRDSSRREPPPSPGRR